MKRVAILTGGGDCPGINIIIRSIVFKAAEFGYEALGILRGWQGLLDPPQTMKLDIDDVEEIHFTGGTILLTSRHNPYRYKVGDELKDRHHEVIENLEKLGCESLIAIGGHDTLSVAFKLWKEGVNVVGIPKTIDNDVHSTDYTIGFDTGINIATEAIDRLHTTARSHERVLVVEIMGRHMGWLTLHAGLAAGAHLVIIPEVPFNVDEICAFVKHRKDIGKLYTLIAIAEGAVPQKGSTLAVKKRERDEFDHFLLGGISEVLAQEIEERTGLETRNVILGHLQRGGTPTTFDRFLGMQLGIKAMELIADKTYGRMASIRTPRVTDVPLEEAVSRLKTVPIHLYESLRIFFR